MYFCYTEKKMRSHHHTYTILFSMSTHNIFSFWSNEIEAIGDSFRLCVWNVHKCLSQKITADMQEFFQELDIVMIQEAVLSERWTMIWKNLSDFNWDFFRSFSLMWGTETGVLTGSKYRQKILAILPSVDREPILRTPKATGISLIDIVWRTEQLLIVNTHAMNFNFGAPFLRQIQSVQRSIEDHVWPMIWAWDFNTWSQKRMRALAKIADELGLDWLIPEHDRRLLKLDHILYRGVSPRSSRVCHDIKTSDHFPIWAEFEMV